MDKLTANDTKLRESYNERTRRGQAFTADLSQYDAKLRPTIQRAIDNGEINNTRATHAFVEGLAKIEAEKGIGFDFTNNSKLAELGLTVAGRNVGGYVDGANVTLNLSSSEALNKVVGHEVTHVFEGSGQYDALMTAMKEFAAESGIDWDARVQEMTERYKNVKNADPEKELLADLVGEYLFTDSGFVRSLSTKNPGLFKKIYEEIKYLAKTFAGTKQGAALEKVKNTFAEMYRDVDVKNTAQTDGVKYSLLVKDVKGNTTAVNPAETTPEQIRDYMVKSRKGQLEQYTYFPVSSHTSKTVISTLRNAGIDIADKPLAMQAKKARQSQNDGQHIERDGTVVRHHALTPDEIVEAIEKLDDPIAAIHQQDRVKKEVEYGKTIYVPAPDNFVFFVTLDNGKECAVVIEFNSFIKKESIQKDGLGDDYHTTVTVFEPDQFRDGEEFDYIEYLAVQPSNRELEIKKESPETETAISQTQATVSEKELSNNSIRNPDEKVNGKFSLSGKEQGTAPAGGYRITGEDIALAPTKEDIARMEQEIATAPAALRNDVEDLGAPTREDIAKQERDKKLKGPLLMNDSLDRELEKLYRLQQTGQIQDDAYFLELSKVNEAYQATGRNFNEAFSRVVGAYQGEVTYGTADSKTNAVTKPLSSYPAEKQSAIRSYLQSVDEQIKAFVKRVKDGDLRFERRKVSDVNERAASDIQKLLGIDVSGYTHNINTSGVQHILRRHGKNGKQDSTMSVDDDIARVGWVLDNYDSVDLLTKDGEQVYSSEFKDKDNNPVPQIRFIKKIDGTYYVVEAACENEYQKLWVQSAYLQKNEDVTQVSAEGQEANHKTYAQGELASPSSKNSISQTSNDVKQKKVEAVLGEKGAYVSKQANALYDEVKSMQKGKRVSNTLSYLLDTLDLSEEHKAESYNSLRTALLNIRDNPNQVVNPNSSVEAAAREMLGREYDAMAEDYANAEGVAKSFYTKMESLRTELENNQRMREESNADFDNEIARLQAEYEGKKNKNTKAANDLLRRIERVQRLKSQVDADYGKRIDRLGEQLERISKPEYKTAMQRKAKMEEYTNRMAELVGDTSTWVDKKMERLTRKVLHKSIMENIKDAIAKAGFDLNTILKNAKKAPPIRVALFGGVRGI